MEQPSIMGHSWRRDASEIQINCIWGKMNEQVQPDGNDPLRGKNAKVLDGVVQLRFSDEAENIRSINAAEMAEAIQGLVEFTSGMAKAGLFGDGVPPELRVRPPREGSFILEAVLQLVQTDPGVALGTAGSAGAALTAGLRVGIRRLRGEEPTDFEYLENGDVKVTWPHHAVDQIPSQVWDQLRANKRPTRRALRKIMAPLSDEADSLEVRDGTADQSTSRILESEPEVVASRSDYRIAVEEPDDVTETVQTIEAEAQLTSIDFRPGEKWRIKTLDGTRQATMEDEEFSRRLDNGMALHKNDIFDVTIREVRTVKNGRTSREWSLIKVTRKRRGEDDDHNESSSGESATPE